MAEVTTCKRKNGFVLDWATVLDDEDDDDLPPELLITSSKRRAHDDIDYRQKSVDDLQKMISKHKGYLSSLKLSDNGDKIKATIRKCEAELHRRNTKDGVKYEESIQLSDQSDNGRKDGRDKTSLASPTFGNILSKKLDQNERTVNAFDKEMSFFNPRQGRKMSQNGRFLNRGRSNQQSSSRSNQFQSPITLGHNGKYKISKFDDKVNCAATPTLDRVLTNRTPAPQDQPSTKLKPQLPSSYYLVDEDIEDPYVLNTTLHRESLSDCMKDVKIYYPSREDRDPVEVIYSDMECLAPEACLSSTIMNFYTRYLRQSSSECRTRNCYFFNTYFYNKLQKLNYRKDSFIKFRKWWKGVNIFEKAYILLPVHESAHWSLGIICIPTDENQSGPIVLHLDSLGLHDSSSIFDNIRRFLKEEWSHLTNSEVSLDTPIMNKNWENIDHRIVDRKVQVPQQKNSYDCGLFVLHYMERFIKEAPERLTEKDLSMFGKQWFVPEEASSLRVRIHNLLVQEFKIAKDKETIMSPKC